MLDERFQCFLELLPMIRPEVDHIRAVAYGELNGLYILCDRIIDIVQENSSSSHICRLSLPLNNVSGRIILILQS